MGLFGELSGILKDINDFLELIARIAVVIGIPYGIISYLDAVKKEQSDREKEQRDREYGTYNALDDKYIEFQKLCLAESASSIYDLPGDGANPNLTDKEIYLFTILFSILERAYLIYLDKSPNIRQTQWTGWANWIAELADNKRFKKAWTEHGATFDAQFEEFVRPLVARPVPPAPNP